MYYYFTEDTSMDSRKVIYENVKKKNIPQLTYVYTGITDILKFCEVLFCAYYKGLICL